MLRWHSFRDLLQFEAFVNRDSTFA